MGAKKAKEISRVFQELFSPNAGNVHIYISKMSELSRRFKNIAILLRNMDSNLTEGRVYSNGRQQLTPDDKNRFLELKGITSKLKAEMRARGQKAHINQISVLMHTDFKQWADLPQIESLSKHFNGEVPGTFPHRMVALSANMAKPLSKLKDVSLTDKAAIRATMKALARENEG